MKIEVSYKGKKRRVFVFFLLSLGILLYWFGANMENFSLFVQIAGIILVSFGAYFYYKHIIISYIYELGKNELRIYECTRTRQKEVLIIPYSSIIDIQDGNPKKHYNKLYSYCTGFNLQKFFIIYSKDGCCYKFERDNVFIKKLKSKTENVK